MPREHGDSGEYVETVTLADVLDTFDHVEGPVVLSADVADRLGCSRETARRKLEALHDRGDLRRRKVSRRVIYWRPESGQERRETAVDTDAVQTPPSGPNTESEDTRPEDTDDDLGAVVDAVAEAWDDTDDRLAARKDAARAVLAYAREHGTVSKQEAEEEVYPAHPVEGQTPDTWYRQNVRPVLNEAAEYDPSARAYRLVEDVHP
jgi:predicted ArsR family transcriptional regulator